MGRAFLNVSNDAIFKSALEMLVKGVPCNCYEMV